MDEKCLDCKDRVERDLTIGVLRMQKDAVLTLCDQNAAVQNDPNAVVPIWAVRRALGVTDD